MHKARWTLEKLTARIKLVESAVYRHRHPMESFRFQESTDGLVGPEIDDSDWKILGPGTYWGKSRQDFTLRTKFSVPSDWDVPIGLYLPMGTSKSLDALAFLYGPEALAYLDGIAYQGVDPNHQEILLPEEFMDGRNHLVALHGWTGIKDERYEIGQPCIVKIDQPTRDFIGVARIALEVARELADTNPLHGQLLNILDEAFLMIDLREPWGNEFYESIRATHRALRNALDEATPITSIQVAGVGHAHIDVAWLWPLSQTRRKAARTFYTVLRLMEQFPEFHFTQSQPQLYEYVKEDHPELYKQIKCRVDEGRWETIGGMWIEADCNLTGAESLARQLLLGRRFFLENFGKHESPVLWLPDVFGYAWQLPQLIRQAGLEYFVTAKLSWNQYNRIPYDAFWWQGLDGTRVMTYFITTAKPGWWGATYSADLTPDEVLSTWDGLQQKEILNEYMIAYGHGDGGGGPTRQMLENGRVMSCHPGLPIVHLCTVKEFLDRLQQETEKKLPVWNGELYLELHRGTYTSQARNKRANRKSEFLLQNTEFLATWASLLSDYQYPHEKLQQAWKLLCLNQFHDIIPGSSITQVYKDSDIDYEKICRLGEQLREDALAALDRLMPKRTELMIFNPTSFPRSEVVEISNELLVGKTILALDDGSPLPTQSTKECVLIEVPTVPPYGYLALGLDEETTPPAENTMYAGSVAAAPSSEGTAPECTMVLENSLLRCEFDNGGNLVRLFDKTNKREALVSGERANQWQAFEDRPLDWEAWDIEIYYEEKQFILNSANSIEALETGPLRACLEIRGQIFNSKLVQRVYLYRDSLRLDFDTWIDWQERHMLLKVAFPVRILNPTATYEIQWGNVERPTHRNTSWDWARFESCAHKWVDISEGNYGVSLLNDCKYGHDIHHNVIRLTILKGATFPDPEADLGIHTFKYSLFPHSGDWRNGTVPEAYALNNPLIVHHVQNVPQGANQPPRASLFQVNSQAVVIETIKKAEDSNGVIVRMYEHQRTRGYVELECGIPLAEASLCNLLEEEQEKLNVTTNKVGLMINPYQISTVRLCPTTERSG